MSDKKLWEKIITDCELKSTFRSKYNKFVKHLHSTEDDELRNLIDKYLKSIDKFIEYDSDGSCDKKYSVNPESRYIVSGYVKTSIGVVESCFSSQNEIKRYCEKCLKSEKPEWQIIAEKNGWEPKE